LTTKIRSIFEPRLLHVCLMEKSENIVRKQASIPSKKKKASMFKSKMSSFVWKHTNEGPRKTTKKTQTVHE
jgi:hypothetical protein